MLYKPDLGFHGTIVSQAAETELWSEPTLTLCEQDEFGYWGGPLAHRVFQEVASTSAFSRIAGRAKRDGSVTLRITTHTLWLEPNQVPSARRDWHLDRVGALTFKDNTELADLRDPFGFPSFILVSMFFPAKLQDRDACDKVSTEFALDTFEGLSGEYLVDPRKMTEDINDAFRRNPGLRTIKAGDRMIVSFCPRTAHRPGEAIVSGWRFFLRIGLYTSGDLCSPYPSHYVFFTPAFDLKRNTVVFRMAGRKEEAGHFDTRSVSLKDRAESALSFASQNRLALGGNQGVDHVNRIINKASSRWGNRSWA